MALRKVELIVVIPVGPTCRLDYILDTIASVEHYTTPDRRIILVDDSQKGTCRQAVDRSPGLEVDIISTPKNFGHGGGLYASLSLGYAHAVKNYRFDALLRLDTDALVTGPGPERDAISLFERDPSLAIGGLILKDDQHLSMRLRKADDPNEFRAAVFSYLKRPFSLYRLQMIRTYLALRRLYRRAVRNDYTNAVFVFGGTYIMSEAFLRCLAREGLLPNRNLRFLDLEEDHLFSLAARAIGMDLADMGSESLPFGCDWKNLPASPQDLLAQGKKVVHSTRRWEGMGEDDIRAVFRAQRRQETLRTEKAPGR